MLTRFLGTFILLSSLAVPVRADVVVDTAVAASGQFARDRGLELNQPSYDFVGVHARGGGEADVFSRWSQYDAWFDTYDCREVSECRKVTGQPRCFYVPDTGRYSISDALSAAGLMLERVRAERSARVPLRDLKVWQSGKVLYGKIVLQGDPEDSAGQRFACAYVETGLTCLETSQTQNEP